MPIKNIIRWVSTLALAASFACGTPLEDEESASLYDAEREWVEFRQSVYREPFEPHVFIVEGDIPISNESELRRYYDTYVARTSQALTVRTSMGADVTWTGLTRFDLSYCVSDTFGSRKQEVVDGMNAAALSWSDRTGVRFRHLPEHDANCTAQNTDVVFDVNPVIASYFARAFFPDDARAQRNLLISDDAFTTTAGGRDFQGILRHELGHALGFRHEHIWSTTCAGESTTDARLLTEYDVNSVMHYPQCRPVNEGGYRQSETDYRGAVSLYGLAPALIIALP
jgi:hypothetical protein